uniref:Ribonuclease H protein At1g65750 family n=1 Tax=Cajanus cajan TaxID=3821 RepID=A0A151RTM0_CAJCA|nr:Putative ribonuclease H protein At1g65750 family [Cajanus cajan]
MTVFNQLPFNPNQIVCEIKGRTGELIKVNSIGPKPTHHNIDTNLISWSRPPPGVLKLNCDGAVVASSIASCGGVIRNSNGKFIFAFSNMIGVCSVVQAELCAIFHGLRLLKERSLMVDIIIESDSALAVKFLNEGCSREHPYYSLVNHIVRMAGDFPSIDCTHVLREANQVADGFAKFELSISEGMLCFDSPPS